ncbi:MAG: ABC transporter substrate-binding protein, partial [Lachnospiraceae bacterium]|nr:ABC transporter substrate-binding protein [Lachnospiraceae bacterium]
DEFTIEVGQQSLAEGLYLNNEYGPLKDVKVRQALSYAVDFSEIDKIVTGGVSHVLKTGMFPSFKEYYNSDTEKNYSYDVEKAKELLKEAGQENLELEITIPNNYQLHISVAEILVDQLKKAGVKASIKQVDWPTWLSDVYQGRKYQATVIALDATMAPGDVLRYFYEGHKSNFVNFNNKEFNELYEKAMAATDQAEKTKYYKEAQTVLTDNAASVWLMSPSIMVAVKKEIKGYTFYPIYVQDLSKLSVEK